jgi:UDP-N-acetylmuramoyl-tripeptide--D-alanyl-D-alanine ligase
MADAIWTLSEAAAAMGADFSGLDPGAAIHGVSIDSRTLEAGDLFFAIRGERTDGHAYVAQALERGAVAAVVERGHQAGGPLLHVDDTLGALNRLGVAARARTGARVIGVTGSVGKTGTKEMLRVMLSAQAPAHASAKSYNNLWGVPLSLARMPRDVRFGVFEMGMNHAGEITPLTQMVRPHIAIITTVAPVHIEFFNSVAEIADAKAEIMLGLEAGGVAILPAENEHYTRLVAHAERLGVRVVAFGLGQGCDARLMDIAAEGEGLRAQAEILGETVAFTLNAPGAHLAMNAVAALAAAKLAGADLQSAAAALKGFETPEGRGQRFALPVEGGELLLIDESYNANPASMRAALDVLARLNAVHIARRIAVLGDMLELGHGSSHYHAELAEAIDFRRIDLVFCAGPQMRHLYERVPAEHRGGYAETSEALAEILCPDLRAGDAVMVKGSLGSRMVRVVEAVKALSASWKARERGKSAA